MKTKTPSKRLEWLTPPAILDLGYAFHVAGNPETQGTPTGELARRQVEQFQGLVDRCRVGCDAHFLMAVSAVIVSLANGIGRNKREFKEAERLADQERSEMRDALMNSTKRSVLGRLSINLIRAALLGGIGFAMVKAVVPSLEMAAKTDSNYTSLAMAMALLLAGSYVQSYLNDFSRDRISLLHEHSCGQAKVRYLRGSRAEYQLAQFNAERIWEEYTGKDYRWSVGFERVFDGELELLEARLEHRKVLRENVVLRLWRTARGERVTSRGVITTTTVETKEVA